MRLFRRLNIAIQQLVQFVPYPAKTLGYHTEEQMTLLNNEGNHIKSVLNDTNTNNFLLQNDGFLVGNGVQMNILKIDMSGKYSIFKKLTPLQTWFLGEALNGNILVSLIDKVSGTRTECSQRKVQMMSSNGDLLHTYECGEDDKTPMLTRPGRATQNFNSDVCVVNQYEAAKGNWRGNVCVFYEDSGLKFVYRGQSAGFNSMGISCDSLCNIICVNNLDNTIHVVSSEGAFLKYLFTRDTCIPKPMSMALHRGVLWVRSMEEEVRVYRYTY